MTTFENLSVNTYIYIEELENIFVVNSFYITSSANITNYTNTITNSYTFTLVNNSTVSNCVYPNYFEVSFGGTLAYWQLYPSLFIFNNKQITNCVNFDVGNLGTGTVWFINDDDNNLIGMVVEAFGYSIYITSVGTNNSKAQVCTPIFNYETQPDGTQVLYCSGVNLNTSIYYFEQTTIEKVISSQNPYQIENIWNVSSNFLPSTTTTVNRIAKLNDYIENNINIELQQLTGTNYTSPCYAVVQSLIGIGYSGFLLSTYYIPSSFNTGNLYNEATENFISSYGLYQFFLDSIQGL